MMPRPKWNSGMPVESMRVPSGASSPLRGQHAMPDGVVEPMFMAATVIAEYRREKTIRRSASTRPAGQIITVTGAVVSQQETQERERLFSRIRRGDKKAATELWETRRAWVMRGGGKGVVGREGAQRDEARRSVAHEGAAAPSLTKEAT